MHLLYYWREDNYRRDMGWGAGYHLNQPSKLLHGIELGESLWALTRWRGRYVLAARLMVCAKTENPAGFRYGRYRVWGDLRASAYFRVDNQPDISELVRQTSVTANAPVLGHSFQGHRAVKPVTEADHALLESYARNLDPEPRARILPEERLEALLALGDPAGVDRLTEEVANGLTEARRRYLYEEAPRRSRRLVRELKELYEGRCQICDWDPRACYGEEGCEAHHVRWLSRGGVDELSNLVLLCPNHHRMVHAADAPFDWRDGAFVFRLARESLVLNRHELVPA